MRSLLVGLVAVVGFAAGWLNHVPPEAVAPRPPSLLPHVYPTIVYDAQPAPPIPPLRSFLGADDSETARNARVWFTAHEAELSALWQEPPGDRLLAWYGMALIHLAAPYGVSEMVANLRGFVEQGVAHCGGYALAQELLYREWGLKHRNLTFDVGWHGWVEVEVAGRWELFDATTALWFDVSMTELVAGQPRHFRRFYSPLDDSARPDARAHMRDGKHNAPRLRAAELCLGFCHVPPGRIIPATTTHTTAVHVPHNTP